MLAGIFKDQLAPHLSGVLEKMFKCQGLDHSPSTVPSDPEIQWVVKKRLKRTRCVRGLKGCGAAPSRVTDAPAASQPSDTMTRAGKWEPPWAQPGRSLCRCQAFQNGFPLLNSNWELEMFNMSKRINKK